MATEQMMERTDLRIDQLRLRPQVNRARKLHTRQQKSTAAAREDLRALDAAVAELIDRGLTLADVSRILDLHQSTVRHHQQRANNGDS